MADLVRLAIVYDTSQAAASLQRLNTGLTGISSAQRKAGIAALTLAQSFETGSISAVGMAKSLGSVASVMFGPWGLALAFGAAILTFFANKTAKAKEEQEKFQDQLRDVRRRVDDLLGLGGEKTPFSTEIERLTDLIETLDKKIKAANNSWGTLLQGGLAAALTMLGFGNAGAALQPGAPPEVAQRGALQGQRNRLTPAAEAAAELIRYNRALEEQGRIFGVLSGGPIEALRENIKLLQDHLGRLAKIEGPDAATELQRTGMAIQDLTARLQHAERAAQLMERGLFTMADAIEDFVLRGTFAFTDFLNNILRLLYRAASEDIIGGIMRSFGGGGGTGTVTPGTPIMGDPTGIGGPSVSVTTNVNFTVQAIDAQGVASFLNSNGPQIAAVVAGHAERSAGLRRKLARG